MASRAAQRSGKVDQPRPAPVRVTVVLDGEEIVVDVDLEDLTFREQHDVSKMLRRLVEVDDDGKAIWEPDSKTVMLAYAWRILARTRDDVGTFDEWLDVPRGAVTLDVGEEDRTDPEA